MSRDALVLRTVYVDNSTDRALTIQSQAIGVSKASLFRRWLVLPVFVPSEKVVGPSSQCRSRWSRSD